MTPAPEIEVLAEGLGSPEGPDLLPDGRIVFVETFLCRVSAWSPERGVHEYAYVGGAPNACLVGLDGVYVAQNGTTAGPWRSPDPTVPSIQRIAADGSVATVVTAADGKPLVGPNDLAFGPDGRLYFTDPGAFDQESPDEGQVCVVEPDGTASVLERVGPTYPNGIVVEPDGAIVWNESYPRRVRRRRPDGSVELLATLPEDRVADGMKIAEGGRIYVAGVSSGGLDVLAPDGERVGFVLIGGEPLNCVFDGTDLYVADFGEGNIAGDDPAPATGRLLRVRLGVAGRPLHRGAIAA
jgi:gluconolactonase